MKISDNTRIKSVIFENSVKDLFRIELDENGDVKDIFTLEAEKCVEKTLPTMPTVTANPYEEELSLTRRMINAFKEYIAPTIDQKRQEYEEWKKEHEFFKKYNVEKLKKYINNLDDFHDKDMLENQDKVMAWLKDNGYFDQIKNMDESQDDYYAYTAEMLHRAFYAVVKDGYGSFHKSGAINNNEANTETTC